MQGTDAHIEGGGDAHNEGSAHIDGGAATLAIEGSRHGDQTCSGGTVGIQLAM